MVVLVVGSSVGRLVSWLGGKPGGEKNTLLGNEFFDVLWEIRCLSMVGIRRVLKPFGAYPLDEKKYGRHIHGFHFFFIVTRSSSLLSQHQVGLQGCRQPQPSPGCTGSREEEVWRAPLLLSPRAASGLRSLGVRRQPKMECDEFKLPDSIWASQKWSQALINFGDGENRPILDKISKYQKADVNPKC